jgi:hypothetical protein
MQNDDKGRPDQPPIHTHLPDTVPQEDVKKIVGDEAVPHGADYNQPPPAGAGKSMGSGLDDSVGGPGLGATPVERGDAATTRDQDSRADDQHMGNRQQGSQQQGAGNGRSAGGADGAADQQTQSGSSQSAAAGNAQRDAGARSDGLLPAQGADDGRFEVAEEVSFDQQSDQARKVGSMEDAAKGTQGDKLADAVARSLGKDGDEKG